PPAILIHADFTPIHAGSEKIISDFYGTSTKQSSLFAAKKAHPEASCFRVRLSYFKERTAQTFC
ncbi:hypothetical protein, partial [Faecalibacterium sp. Marseille-P9312]|uniref:hypothetical protein n=1 Tax=Faecalibacterium sp. Marseille-P9312 TaxID=2580425 RepID=UPI001A9C2206